MKQPIYNNRNATNDEKVQENLVTKTNTLTVRSIEQDLETVRSVRKTNMADYLSRAETVPCQRVYSGEDSVPR